MVNLYELEPIDDLVEPAMVVAFDGWVSAGNAGSATADHIAEGGEIIATFDSDLLYDFRANRPTVRFSEGVLKSVAWPEMVLRRHSVGGRDLLVLSGTEPNWHWQLFAREVVALEQRLGVTEHVSVGGIPWAAAHTRPTSLITTASTTERIDPDGDHPEGELQVPGAAVTIVAYEAARAGIPTIGFWARVPHYVGATYYPTVVVLVERLSRHLNIDIPLLSLTDEAAAQRQELDTLVERQPDARAIVEQLERLMDEQQSASGDELAAEIERYLQQRSPEDGPFGEE